LVKELVLGSSDVGVQGMDSVGAGGRLGANDGMKGSRSEDTFKSLILPKIDIFRPRFLELQYEMIRASCFSLR